MNRVRPEMPSTSWRPVPPRSFHRCFRSRCSRPAVMYRIARVGGYGWSKQRAHEHRWYVCGLHMHEYGAEIRNGQVWQ